MNLQINDIEYELDARDLSPSQLVDKKKILGHSNDQSMELYHYFSCSICLKIIREPLECTQCQTSFCKKCIDTWFNNSSKCPVQCSNAKYDQLNPRVLKFLKDSRFFCPVKACPHSKTSALAMIKAEGESAADRAGLPYLEALEHLQSCQHMVTSCPFGCDDLIPRG